MSRAAGCLMRRAAPRLAGTIVLALLAGCGEQDEARVALREFVTDLLPGAAAALLF